MTPYLDATVIVARRAALARQHERMGKVIALYLATLDDMSPLLHRLHGEWTSVQGAGRAALHALPSYRAVIDSITSSLAALFGQVGALAAQGRSEVIQTAAGTVHALVAAALRTTGQSGDAARAIQIPAQLTADALAEPLLGGATFRDWRAGLTALALGSAISAIDRVLTGDEPTTPVMLTDAVRDGLNIAQYRALALVRTEPINAGRFASLAIYAENPDLIHGWIFWANPNACPVCVARHGEFHTLAEPFDSHPNCFVAGTMVHGPKPLAGMERWYSGDIVEIETEFGRRLTVTPNHPILTPEGWVAAGSLNEGSDLVCSGIGQIDAIATNGDDHDIPAPIEEVARSLRGARSVATNCVPTTAVDFHGDGLGSEVCVIRTNSHLRDRVDPAFAQEAPQFGFIRRCVQDAILSRFRGPGQFLDGPDSTFGRFVRGTGEPLALLCADHRHMYAHAFTGATRSDAMSDQALPNCEPTDPECDRDGLLGFTGEIAGDDLLLGQRIGAGLGFDGPLNTERIPLPGGSQHAAFGEDRFEEIRAQTFDRGTNTLHAFPANVTTDRVLKISIRAFAGHVYNLQTTDGWYFANGIVTHNCACWPVPETQDPGSGDLTNAPWVYERGVISERYMDRAHATFAEFSQPFQEAS